MKRKTSETLLRRSTTPSFPFNRFFGAGFRFRHGGDDAGAASGNNRSRLRSERFHVRAIRQSQFFHTHFIPPLALLDLARRSRERFGRLVIPFRGVSRLTWRRRGRAWRRARKRRTASRKSARARHRQSSNSFHGPQPSPAVSPLVSRRVGHPPSRVAPRAETSRRPDAPTSRRARFRARRTM